MVKICSKCKESKELTEYHKHKASKDGHKSACKPCRKVESDNRKLNIKDNYIVVKEKSCNRCNKIKKIKEFSLDKHKKDSHNTICKVCVCIYVKYYYENHKEKKKQDDKNYRENNKESIAIYKKNYYENNKELISIYQKKYQENNKESININKQEYHHHKYHNNIQYKLLCNIRSRLYSYLTITNISKTNITAKTIGISPKLFSEWIQFNMRLDKLHKNDIHLDHFYPLSKFNISSFDDIIETKCNHWTNIRPMLPFDNLEKSDKQPSQKEIFKMTLRIVIFKIKKNI